MMMQRRNNVYRIGRHPGYQGPRSQVGDQAWVEKLATGQIRVAANTMKIGTWNVRTLREDGRLELLRREIEEYDCDILAVQEVRWLGKGEMHDFIWSGADDYHRRGVGFLLSKRAKRCMIGYNPVSPRIMVARFNCQPINITVVQVYAPTSDCSDADIESFYAQLDEALDSIPKKDIRIVLGDWNAKIGKDRDGYEEVLGKYGYGDRNDRGERLIQWAMDKGLYVCNSRFEQKPHRKWTWLSPDGRTRNMIDLILVDKRWKTAMWNCRTYQGADMSSDHSLVMGKFKVRLKCTRKHQVRKKYNIEQLKDVEIETRFREALKYELASEPIGKDVSHDVDRLNRSLEAAMEKMLVKVTVARKSWISQETLELADKKRQCKSTRLQSEEKMAEYRRICNKVRRSARKDKNYWVKEQCKAIETSANENKSKQVYQLVKKVKGCGAHSRISIIKDKNGNVLQDKDDVMSRWTEYCAELYSEDRQFTDLETEMAKESPPINESDNFPILLSEVQWAVRKLKSGKAAGSDGIVSEVLQAGGDVLVQELHNICNTVWENEEAPEEWLKAVMIPIPKKGDSLECKNHRTLSLINSACKVMLAIVLERLKYEIEPHLSEEQAGFRKDRGTVQQILALRLIAEKMWRKNRNIYNCFVDFRKAFDTVNRDLLWSILKFFGVNAKLVRVLQAMYQNAKAVVRLGKEYGDWFQLQKGVRQGDPISPFGFIIYLEYVMKDFAEMGGVSIHGRQLNNLKYADDIDMLSDTQNDLQNKLDMLDAQAMAFGLDINPSKTKTMVMGQQDTGQRLGFKDGHLENVSEFEYLGSLITWDGDCSKDIRRRIGKAYGVLAGFNKIWDAGELSLGTKLQLLHASVFSVLLYAGETWTLKKEDERRLRAFEMKCYRRLLGVKWFHFVTNDEIKKLVKMTDDIVTTIKKRKVRLFGHICRMDDNRLLKVIMLGMVDGTNRRGRPKRSWLDDVKEWTGLSIRDMIDITYDRERWKVIVNSNL